MRKCSILLHLSFQWSTKSMGSFSMWLKKTHMTQFCYKDPIFESRLCSKKIMNKKRLRTSLGVWWILQVWSTCLQFHSLIQRIRTRILLWWWTMIQSTHGKIKSSHQSSVLWYWKSSQTTTLQSEYQINVETGFWGFGVLGFWGFGVLEFHIVLLF